MQKHVLIVEDEALIAMDMEQDLEAAGHRVTVAASIAEALEVAGGANIDLAVLDYNFGGQLTIAIAHLLASRHIPFVVCTGARRDELSQAFDGATHISKPYRAEELMKALFERSRTTS